MTDKPPTDFAEHAEDFSRRYADDMEMVAGQTMIDLGIPDGQMGARDPDRNREHHCFFRKMEAGWIGR
jgi:hypothetical protein